MTDRSDKEEYRRVSPEEKPGGFSDAGYIPQSEAPEIRSLRFSPSPEPKPQGEPREKPRRRGISAGTVVALCLICGIFGGALGGAGIHFFLTRMPEESIATLGDVSQSPPIHSDKLLSEENLPRPGELYESCCSQVVGIFSETGELCGSGLVFSEEGYILTDCGVLDQAKALGNELSVELYGGRILKAEVLGCAREGTDSALLKVDEAGLRPAELCRESPALGDTVYAVSNPGYALLTGRVSAPVREVSEGDRRIGAFSFDVSELDKLLGGPLFNEKGQVVGLITAHGLALPMEEAERVALSILERGDLSGRAVLGIIGETLSDGIARYYSMTRGIYAWSVQPDSGAEKAGLRSGDIITALEGETLTNTEALQAAELSYNVGDEVCLTVYRAGETLEIPVVFGEE